MASEKEIDKHLKIALREVGEIKPRFDKRFNAWIFRHRAYPDVEYAGASSKEVIKNYPLYLREFIQQRLDRNIDQNIEKKTKGRGGKRAGAGRPSGTKKAPTKRISLPLDVVQWFHKPHAIDKFRELMAEERED